MRLALEEDDRISSSIPAIRRGHLATLSRKHVVDRQRFLCELLTISYERRRPHEVFPEADSFSREFLLKGLRVSARRQVIPDHLSGLYEFEEGNRGYDQEGGVTKAYHLRDAVRAVLDEVYSSPDPLPIEGSEPLGVADNGLPAALANQGLFVPAHLPIPEGHLQEAEERIRSWMEPDNHRGLLDPHRTGSMSLRSALQILRACRAWRQGLGGFPNLYRLQSHGRLGPRGGAPHMITLPKTVRHLVLHHSGLEDFDLVSCHWSIIRSLVRAVGLDTPWIDAYLGERDEWHREWQKRTLVFPDDFKRITSSWLTGGVLSMSRYSSGTRAVGRYAIGTLQEDGRAVGLYRETRATLKKLMREVAEFVRDGRRKVVINAVGEARDLEKLTHGQLCSHVLTGFEQFAIRTACRTAKGLQAVVYDGFIAEPQDVGPIEAAIRNESSTHLGVTLDLRLKRKPFSARIVDRRFFDIDFDDEGHLAELMAA